MIVREDFYLIAIAVIGEAEGEESKFSLDDTARRFLRSESLRPLLEHEVGADRAGDILKLGTEFIGGVRTVGHYSQVFEKYCSNILTADPEVAAFVRTATFSFLTAWSHRYGGYSRGWTANGSVVTPPE